MTRTTRVLRSCNFTTPCSQDANPITDFPRILLELPPPGMHPKRNNHAETP